MKAIILAAGKGSRLEPITLETPKAMVEVYGKPLLAHNMDKLLPYVDEFIIVVKYKKEKIINYFGESYKGIKIQYHVQGEKPGTGGALIGLKIEGSCFIIASDTIFHQQDIDALAHMEAYGVLAQTVENPEKYGVFSTDSENTLLEVVEKPQNYIGNLASLFYFKLDGKLLDLCQNILPSPRGEYELTDALNQFAQTEKVQVIEISHPFIDITSVDDLLAANTLEKPELGKSIYLESVGAYEIHIGIPQDGIQEIINYTLDDTDTALREGTGDYKNGNGRFTSQERLISWYEDAQRYTFSLLDSKGQLVGIWWGRPAKAPDILECINLEAYKVLEQNKENIHTSGVRIYPTARGKGLASPFLEICSRVYNCIFPNYCMSIDIDERNRASQKSFEKIGFEKVGYGQNINNSRSPDGQIEAKRYVYVKHYTF